jgi:predicted Holliday junction resolvase-like endonuclease
MFWLAVTVAGVLYIRHQRLQLKMLEEKVDAFPKQKADSLKKQRSVVKGQLVEQIAPLLPEFSYDTSDAKFFGQPIDFVVFDGMSEGEVRKVVLLDVKTGKASLNKVQRQIRDAIERGDVEFHTIRIKSIDGLVV